MRHPAFAVLACVWLALFGLGLVRPTYGTALREAEGEGPVAVAQCPELAPTTQAWLQVALLGLSPTACDEEILAAAELPLGSGERVCGTVQWFRRTFAHDFGAIAEMAAERKPRDSGQLCIVERQRELGSDLPWARSSATLVATPAITEHGVRLAGATVAGLSWMRQGRGSPWHDWCEPGVETSKRQVGRELELSFDRPRLLLHDETGFAVLLRATRTPIGREPLERRATWRTFFASWLAPAAANERDLVAEQLALAGLVLREAPLLAAARSAPLPPPLADDAGGWRRFARRALAIAHGTLPPDDELDPYGCEPLLAVRALRTQPDAAVDAELARQLLASQSAPLASVPLVDLLGDDERAGAPAIVALREAAVAAATPSWLRGAPWLLPCLLAVAAVVLGWLVRLPRVGAVRPLGLGGMLVLALTMLVQGWPFDAWARALLLVPLCLPRWRAMDRLWRVVAGLTLFATVVALVLPFGLLPRTAPWGNLITLTTAGTWLLALGVVIGNRRWLAPQLLAAVVWLMVVPIAAFFVPGLAPVGLLVVRLGAVYTITVLLLVLLFVLLWRRQSGHPGRIDEPPLVAAQPV
jgi:hypothetical protein